MNNVTYSYSRDRNPVLDDVSMLVQHGRWIALLGANGSGKSTLAKLCNGLLQPTLGNVTVNGKKTCNGALLLSIRQNLGLVLQDPDNQIICTKVFDEVAFGPQNLGLSQEEIAERVNEALFGVGLGGFEERDPNSLSGGEKQRLVLAGVLAMRPDFLVLDEPCSMLDSQARKDILAVLEAQKACGKAILHITHSLKEAMYADKVFVLHKGRIAFFGKPQDLMSAATTYGLSVTNSAIGVKVGVAAKAEEVCEKGIAPEAGDAAKACVAPEVDVAANAKAAALEDSASKVSSALMPRPATVALLGKNLSFAYVGDGKNQHEVIRNADISLAHGELCILTGRSGSGKTTLLKLLAGLLKPQSGAIALFDSRRNRKYAIKPGRVGIVFQRPEDQLFGATVFEDIAFAPALCIKANKIVRLRRIVKDVMAQVGLDYKEFAGRSPYTLSGGEARRVAIAGILALGSQVLLLDEPTAALDAQGKQAILEIVLKQIELGVSVVIATHDADLFRPYANSELQIGNDGQIKKQAAVRRMKLRRPVCVEHRAGGKAAGGFDADSKVTGKSGADSAGGGKDFNKSGGKDASKSNSKGGDS